MVKRIVCLQFLLVIIAGSNISAQQRDEPTFWQTLGNDFSISLFDGLDFFNVPSRFDGADWTNTAAVIAGTGIVVGVDEPVREHISEIPRTPMFDDVMSVFRENGNLYYPASAAGVGYLTGLITSSSWVRTTSRMLLQSLLYSGVTTGLLKVIIGRSRPYLEEGNTEFSYVQTTDDYWSLPSGHTTVAFAVSSVLSERLGNIWASIGLYGIASLTGFSRIYHDRHWASDVFLGAAIGTAAGLFVSERERMRDGDQTSESGLLLIPNFRGVTLTYRF